MIKKISDTLNDASSDGLYLSVMVMIFVLLISSMFFESVFISYVVLFLIFFEFVYLIRLYKKRGKNNEPKN